MENLEIKAFYHDLLKATDIALRIGAVKKWSKNQIDTYFSVPLGRLKLREESGSFANLISYNRPNQKSAKVSEYYIYQTKDNQTLKHVLSQVIPIDIVVEKKRTLFLWENVRIHLDNVKFLGNFIEFEAVLSSTKDRKKSLQQLKMLISQFDIKDDTLIPCGYFDLLEQKKKNKGICKEN